MSLSKSPVFNLKVVLQETNIAADTLRAWERRYGLPMPQRTAGGHRLYSQYDIETIRWLLTRQAEGLSISRAVDLWNEHNASGVDPLAGFNAPDLISTQAIPALYVSPDTNLDYLRTQWIGACMKFSESHAEQVLNQAFSMFPVEAVCMEVLQKGMAEIGNLWYENKATVQQEHFASGLAMRRLDSLLSASPAPSRSQTVLVGCPPNEWHTFTPLLLSLLLRRRGLNVVYLGANVPVTDFEETVKSVRGKLIILVAQTLVTAAALRTTAQALTDLRIPIGYGGRIFTLLPNLTERIAGHYLGDSVTAALESVDSILQAKGETKANPSVSVAKKYREAHRFFTSERTRIESTVIESARSYQINLNGLNTGIQYLGDNIAAALQLGDMEYVTNEMEWLKTLLQSHKRPSQELTDFMGIYSRAVDKHINGQGEPIKEWLKAQARKI
ncbi:HTH-type transcriptional repressor CarH [Anaerolineales bacterium]|nr:HTH-type transcriptional repressor CarH [Anaerolineales bacterium]